MYCKRVLILQQSDKRFAERNKELCGMVKFVNNSPDKTTVTAFVTNADTAAFGEWWLLLSFCRNLFVKRLNTLNNQVFSVPKQSLDNIGCLLVKKEQRCFETARSFVGDACLCDDLYRRMESLVAQATDSMATEASTVAQSKTTGTSTETDYEKFVASTSDYYVDCDYKNLRAVADGRYKSVEDYSDAFERFYATGSRTEYYQKVKKEIGKLFVDFPPYFPLVNKYAESFFVRIDFPSSDKYFVFGVLQKDGKVRYICYGLPAERDGFFDKDFTYVENTPVSFWMLFQDADTGQITAPGKPVK